MHTPHNREDAKREATQGLSDMKNKATEAVSGLTDKAKEAGASAMESARESASAVASTVGEWASTAGEKVEDAVSAVGGGIKSLSDTIRENAPREGMIGTAASTLASTLESSGRYLQEEGLKGAADDLALLIRRNPIPAVLIGIGLGFLLARATRS
jgi:hypothetical protein